MPSGSPIEAVWRRRRDIDRRRLLRPMTSSQTIDLAIQLYRTHAGTLIRATAPSALLAYVGLVQVFTFVLPGLFTTSAPHNLQVQVLELAISVGVAALLAVPLCLVGISYPLGFATAVVGRAMHGEPADEAGARKMAEKGFFARLAAIGPGLLFAFGPLIGAVVLMGASASLEKSLGSESWVLVASTMLVLAGFFVSLFSVAIGVGSVSLAVPVQVWEGVGAREAVRRSNVLRRSYPVHGSSTGPFVSALFVASLAFCALSGSLAAMLALGLSSPWVEAALSSSIAGVLVAGALEALPFYVGLLFVLPFLSCAVTVIYFERRVRLEAYDIQVLTADLKGGSPEAG